MTGKDIAYGVGAVVAGFLAWRVYHLASKAVDAGAAAGAAVAAAAKKVVTEDLNPVSDKNVAYTASNYIGSQVTGDTSFNLGSRIFEWLNPAAVAAENKVLGSGTSDVSNLKKQVTQIGPVTQEQANAMAKDVQNDLAKYEVRRDEPTFFNAMGDFGPFFDSEYVAGNRGKL